MTGPVAFLAGVLASVGIVELAAVPRRGGAARRILLAVGRRFGSSSMPKDLSGRLEAAGAPLSLADASALKTGGAAIGALAGLLLAAAAPGRLGLILPPAAAGAGYLALDVWLGARTRARAQAIAIELPDVLDLLRVALAAGLPPTRALAEVGRRHHGVLAAELERAAARSALGVSRRETLATLRRRAPAEGIAAVTTVLERAERLGTPPAEALAALARDARESRARARAEAAARAAPKIQLIVALLLVPSVMLLVAAALAPALLDAV